MKILLSPAKAQDFEIGPRTNRSSKPLFGAETKELVSIMQTYKKKDLIKLMGVSEAIAELNVDRYKTWEKAPELQALFAFRGEVYRAFFDVEFSEKEYDYMDERVRIISGLYGLISPLTMIKPYRLEMGRKVPVGDSKDLYTYWKPKIAKELNKEQDVIINLASNEYAGVLNRNEIKSRIVDIVFKVEKEGRVQIVPVFAKKERGEMAKWMIQNSIDDVNDLKKYKNNDFVFDRLSSNGDTFVFIRRSSLMRQNGN